jgi:choline dehydrogenase
LESEPVAGLDNRTSYQPRGKILGGISSLTGMVDMRGTPADYDGRRQRGCEGWDFAGVLPHFKKAENQERGASEFHGVGGPLNVCDQRYRHELVDAIIAPSVEAGATATSTARARRGLGGTKRRRWPGGDAARPSPI